MWSAQQQSMLNAMGYTLYARPGSFTENAETPNSAVVMTAAAASLDSTLFKAVIRAAQGKDISQLAIDVDVLRNSPQAKRALWSQLRRVLKP